MKQRLQARSHYCEHMKGELYLSKGDGCEEPLQKLKKAFTARANISFAYDILKKLLKRLLSFSIIIHDTYYPNNNLGIFLTTHCNLGCRNCQTSARQAPANDMMTVAQVEKVVNDAIRLDYYWDNVFLTGGEASLHPQLFEILDVIKRYKEFNPECSISLETNGAGNEVQSVLKKLPEWLGVGNSIKKEGKSDYVFVEYNVAPIDSFLSVLADFSKGCSRLKHCYSLCATMYGYYPCSPCMNVARVFGLDIGIRELDQVTEGALRKQLKTLCKYCGFFREPQYGTTLTQTMSRSWKRAFAQYKKHKPELTRY